MKNKKKLQIIFTVFETPFVVVGFTTAMILAGLQAGYALAKKFVVWI